MLISKNITDKMASTSTASKASSSKAKTATKAKAVVDEVEEVNVVPDTKDNTDVDSIASLKALIVELTYRVMTLEGTVEKLSTSAIATAPPTSVKPKKEKEEKEKKPRAPTAYNLFMKEKMHELKETHPTLSNIERMKMAAEAWTESKKSS